MATETEVPNLVINATNIGSIALNNPDSGRVDDGSCASGFYIASGTVGLIMLMTDPSMANAPTSVLAKVELRLNEAATTSNYSSVAVRRGSESHCAGHSVRGGSGGGSCGATAWSGWAECTHSLRPRTIAEAKGAVWLRWEKPVSGLFDSSYHDGTEIRYTYYQMGTPATPSVAPYAVGKLRVTKGSSPTGATHWQVWRSNNGSTGWSLVSASYIAVGTTTFDDTTNHGNGITRYYRIRYSASSVGDFCNYSSNGSATTWDVSDAPTWASPKFTGRSRVTITFDWETPGYDGGSPILEYWYAWKIHGGSYANIDTNSMLTLAMKLSLSAGNRYWFKVRARNAIGQGPYTSEEYHWTLCETPSAPTVTANAVGSLRIQHSDITGIDKWRVMRSATSGGSYSQVYLSGAGAGALDWSDTGEGNGTTWYYKLYARNVDGNDSALGTYASGTTWDVPGTSSDPTLSPNGAGQIEVTKPSNPSDGGESIDFWYVEWDNNSGFPSPTGNSGDIAIGTPTYNATGLGNGNNYYFRVRFKNAVNYGPYSAGTVNETTWDLPTVPQNFDVVSI